MKQDWEIYRDTGILGAYRPEQVILRRSEDGGVETLFRDSTAKWEGDDLTRQRAMLVGGKCFLVTSPAAQRQHPQTNSCGSSTQS